MKRWIFVGLALFALIVNAATNITVEQVYQVMFRPWTRTTAQLPSAGAYTGYVAYNTSNSALTVSDGTSWRTASPILGATTYDFPSLDPTVNGLGLPCAESWAVMATGAVLTDSCSASSNLGVDGGAALLSTAQLSCRVSAANAAVLKLCVQLTDGGSYNLGDAGFYVRVFH